MPRIYKKRELQQTKPDIKILENDNDDVDIKYIVHMADIHIHKTEREEEYRRVFNTLCCDLSAKKINKKNSVIVVAGDVVHNKTDLHPMSVQLIKDFFIMLCEITTTIAITGNHDIGLQNSRHNSLISSASNLKTKNPLYLLDTEGYYQYHNIMFCHTRFQQSKKVLDGNFVFDGYKCALYHGIINGASDNGRVYKNSEEKQYYSTSDFVGCDYVFLGDIHQHSFLKNNIAYPGSLIQQAFDESLDKGYIFWDLKKKKGTFQQIYNDTGKVKIVIGKNGETNYDINKMPKNIELCIVNESSDETHLKKVFDDLRSHNINILKKFVVTIDNKKGNNAKILIGGKEQSLNAIKSDKEICDMILSKIKETNKLNDDKELLKMITELLANNNINHKNMNKNDIKLKLISLEFDNISVYGQNNRIDFNKFRKVMGISAPNSSGKSSFIDAILFSIFESCTRGDRFDLLHTGKKSLSSKVKLEINGVTYTVCRSLQRNSKESDNIKGSVEFYENDVNITGGDKKKTETMIKEKIGVIEDFIVTSIVTQKSLLQGKVVGFAELSAKDKRDLLCRIARLDIYDKMANDVDTKIKSLVRERGRHEKQLDKFKNYGVTAIDIKEGIMTEKKNIMDAIKKLENDRQELEKELELKRKIKYQLAETNFDEIDSSVEVECNENIKDDINALKKEVRDLERVNKKIRTKYEQYDIVEIEKEFKKNNENDIKKYSIELKKKRNQLWKDSSYNYDIFDEEDTDHKIKTFKSDKKKMEDRLKKCNTKLIEINKVINKKIVVVKKRDVIEYEKLVDELNGIIQNKDDDEKELHKNTDLLLEFNGHEYDPNCEFCMKNAITKQKTLLEKNIDMLKDRIKKNKIIIDKLTKEVEKKKWIVDKYEEYTNLTNEKEMKKREKILVQKDCEIYGEKLKNIDKTIGDLERLKENYKKFVDNRKTETVIADLELKINDIKNRVCEEKMEYDKLCEDMLENRDRLDILNRELDLKQKKYDKYVEQKELYEKYEQFTKNELEIEKVNKKITETMSKLSDMNKDLIVLQGSESSFMVINDNINGCRVAAELYGMIYNVLKAGGIVDCIMKDSLIPKFKDIVNNLFIKFGSRPVDIRYTTNSIEIINDTGVNTVRDGCYQSHLNNLIYRIALSQFDNNMKSNFLIIDEVFDSADNTNKEEMRKMIDFLRTQYDWVLIISHDDNVKESFDKMIEIKTNESDNSKFISYV